MGTHNERFPRFLLCVSAFIVAACIYVILGARANREALDWTIRKSRARQIANALQQYHAQYQSFPPVALKDENGNNLHSWRTLVLPFIGAEERAIYDLYDFNTPWDSPGNRELLNKVDVFSGWSGGPYCTVFAIVGPDTLWPSDNVRKVSDLTGHPGGVAAACLVDNTFVYWSEPYDLELEKVVDYFQALQSADRRRSLGVSGIVGISGRVTRVDDMPKTVIELRSALVVKDR